jgi:nitroimidazol reductase NimA-like FMN-containing flavoprotein (pyridoxamine 5'-phosphate oxidase superfamily)
MTDEPGGALSAAELEEFLAQPLLLKLACVRPDGWPYVVPLWFAWYEHKLYVVGRERAIWIDYLRREPRVGVLIDEEARRHRRVQMSATALVVEGPVQRADGSQHWRRIDERLKARYMADEAGRAYAQLTAERPRFLVEITPTQVTSWGGGAWHHRYHTAEPAAPPPTAVVAD